MQWLSLRNIAPDVPKLSGLPVGSAEGEAPSGPAGEPVDAGDTDFGDGTSAVDSGCDGDGGDGEDAGDGEDPGCGGGGNGGDGGNT